MSQGSLNPKIRFLCQMVCSVARGRTDTKVKTEDTLSGFQDVFLQPIIKDRSNNTHWHTTPLCKLSRLHCDIDLLTRSKIFFLIRVISLVSKTEVGPNAPSIQSTFYDVDSVYINNFLCGLWVWIKPQNVDTQSFTLYIPWTDIPTLNIYSFKTRWGHC